MNRRQALIGATAAAGAALLPRKAAAQTKLTIMVFPGMPNLPLFAAQSNGFFAKRDLAVEIKYAPNSDEQRAGLADGRFQLVHSAADNAVAMVEVAKVDVAFRAVNPFLGQALPNGESYGAILLSGLLSSCKRGEVDKLLETAASELRTDGLLALHDSFLPAGVPPPPEVMWGGLARRISRDGCRDWSIERVRASLDALGLANVSAQALSAGTVLVTASKV